MTDDGLQMLQAIMLMDTNKTELEAETKILKEGFPHKIEQVRIYHHCIPHHLLIDAHEFYYS